MLVTLIDNIFTKEVVNDISSGLLVTDTSNHLPVFALFNYIDIDWPKEKCFKYMCDMRMQRIEAFGAALSLQGHIVKQNDVNKSYEGFLNIFNELYGIHYPLKKVCIRNKGHGLLRFGKCM